MFRRVAADVNGRVRNGLNTPPRGTITTGIPFGAAYSCSTLWTRDGYGGVESSPRVGLAPGGHRVDREIPPRFAPSGVLPAPAIRENATHGWRSTKESPLIGPWIGPNGLRVGSLAGRLTHHPEPRRQRRAGLVP